MVSFGVIFYAILSTMNNDKREGDGSCAFSFLENCERQSIADEEKERFTMETWQEIKFCDGLYLISNCGRVLSKSRVIDNKRGKYVRPEKLIKPGTRGRDGIKYQFVRLTRKDGTIFTVSVHRLVAEAFCEKPNGFNVVNHKDRNTLNNSAENLEWCNQQYNNEYSHNKRICQYFDGEKIAEYKSATHASKITHISRTAIGNALNGWSSTAGGYVWKYAN